MGVGKVPPAPAESGVGPGVVVLHVYGPGVVCLLILLFLKLGGRCWRAYRYLLFMDAL